MPTQRLTANLEELEEQVRANAPHIPLPSVGVAVGATTGYQIADHFDIDPMDEGSGRLVFRFNDPAAVPTLLDSEPGDTPRLRGAISRFRRAFHNSLQEQTAAHERSAGLPHLQLIGAAHGERCRQQDTIVEGPLATYNLRELMRAYNFANRVIEDDGTSYTHEPNGDSNWLTRVCISPPYPADYTIRSRGTLMIMAQGHPFSVRMSFAGEGIGSIFNTIGAEGGGWHHYTPIGDRPGEGMAAYGTEGTKAFAKHSRTVLAKAILGRVTELRDFGYEVNLSIPDMELSRIIGNVATMTLGSEVVV